MDIKDPVVWLIAVALELILIAICIFISFPIGHAGGWRAIIVRMWKKLLKE